MKYVCTICGYIYDDDEQNVPFAELPESWSCPICGAPKSVFEPMAEATEAKAETAFSAEAEAESGEEMTKLSAGELAALCSSLARGCEAQYKFEESKLYKKLADYFLSHVPAVKAEGAKELSQLLEKDTLSYAALHATAADKSDRGALRACVWSEKVTRILNSLMNRYEKEGEAAFEGKDIWVCSVCGFVFVGEEPPAVCPVCKVPAWKFVKIGKGRASI